MTTPGDQLKKIARGLFAAAPEGWARALVTVSAVASRTRVVPVFELNDGSVNESTRVDSDTLLTFDDLRDLMYREGAGTWYNATFTLTADGQLETDFDYDNPPFDGDFEADLLEDDQDRYPRSQENLPSWHPSRS